MIVSQVFHSDLHVLFSRRSRSSSGCCVMQTCNALQCRNLNRIILSLTKEVRERAIFAVFSLIYISERQHCCQRSNAKRSFAGGISPTRDLSEQVPVPFTRQAGTRWDIPVTVPRLQSRETSIPYVQETESLTRDTVPYLIDSQQSK